MKPTYLDAGILTAAAKGTEVFSAPAEFFESVEHWVPSSPELSARALDALHVAAAEAAGAELLTAESSTKPMFRVGRPRVVSIRTSEPGETS